MLCMMNGMQAPAYHNVLVLQASHVTRSTAQQGDLVVGAFLRHSKAGLTCTRGWTASLLSRSSSRAHCRASPAL